MEKFVTFVLYDIDEGPSAIYGYVSIPESEYDKSFRDTLRLNSLACELVVIERYDNAKEFMTQWCIYNLPKA
jgi:hypothetical protein